MPDHKILRDRIDRAIGNVLFHNSNYPPAVQTRILGQDIGPLREKLTDAVMAVWPAPADNSTLGWIEEILDGIDREQGNEDEGWWETSVGAKFGSDKLGEIRELFDSGQKGISNRDT